MAARATRSASRKARAATEALTTRGADAVATGPLGALSHDELGVIFDGLANPLQPVIAVAFSSTCLGLRTPLQAAIEVLMGRHARAVVLCRKVGTTCAELRDARVLNWGAKSLWPFDLAMLGMLQPFLTRLKFLDLEHNFFGDAGMRELCDILGANGFRSLRCLYLNDSEISPVGARAFAAALRRGAMANLRHLQLGNNPMGKEAVVALAAPLRKLHALKTLYIWDCHVDDEGVAALVDNLGKDDFKKLEELDIDNDPQFDTQLITDKGVAKLASALDGRGMPKLKWLCFHATNTAALVEAAERRGIGIDPHAGPEGGETTDDDDDDYKTQRSEDVTAREHDDDEDE